MGVQSLDSLREDIWLAMKRPEELNPGTVQGADQLNKAVNRSYRHISLPNIYKHAELETQFDIPLVTAVSSYSFAAASPLVWAIEQVKLEADEIVLRRWPFKWLNELRLTDSRPSVYARRASTLFLNTRPTAAENGDICRIYHTQRIVDLALDADVTVVSQEWDQVIVQGGIFYAWLALDNKARADGARETFGALINEIGATDVMEVFDQEDGPIRGEAPHYMSGRTA